jgi:hypothetical protein
MQVFYGWWIVAACMISALVGNALGLFGAGRAGDGGCAGYRGRNHCDGELSQTGERARKKPRQAGAFKNSYGCDQ